MKPTPTIWKETLYRVDETGAEVVMRESTDGRVEFKGIGTIELTDDYGNVMDEQAIDFIIPDVLTIEGAVAAYPAAFPAAVNKWMEQQRQHEKEARAQIVTPSNGKGLRIQT